MGWIQRVARAGIVVVVVLTVALAVPLHPRICDNYSPLLGCRDAPEVAIPGITYGPSKQAYGSVVEGHKPFRLDHPAFQMISDYATSVLRSDISRATIPMLFRGFGVEPRFWGSTICSARSLELKHTTNGTAARMIDIGRGRVVPVYFGITLQLQIVSAWHHGPHDPEEDEHDRVQQQLSWVLPLHLNTSILDKDRSKGDDIDSRSMEEHPRDAPGNDPFTIRSAADWHHRVPPRRPWLPTVWIAHRMDVSYDPSRSFSVQRHTWRTVGGGDLWTPEQEAVEALMAAATKDPFARDPFEDTPESGTVCGERGAEECVPSVASETDGNASAPAGMFERLGLDESLRGLNETAIAVKLMLRSLCACAGGREGEDADKVVGAGGTTWSSDVVLGGLLLTTSQEDQCMAAFDRGSDGQSYMPDQVPVTSSAKAADGLKDEDNQEPGIAAEALPRLLNTQTWELLQLDPACQGTFPASRAAASLLAGTACPARPEALGWMRRMPAPIMSTTDGHRGRRDTKITVSGNGEHAKVEHPAEALNARNLALAQSARARLAEVLLLEASALTSMPIMAGPVDVDASLSGQHEENPPALEVGADGDATISARPRRQLGHMPYPKHVCNDVGRRCGGTLIGGGNLRIMSFNAWNSNPPSWLYPNPSDRWDRYSKRMDLFADIILSTGPSIVGLQEIRLDISLGGRNEHGQMRHLAERLPGYQYVAQPATIYADDNIMSPTRDEEGVAIISKHPIVATDYAILSRDAADPQDEHARVCLHAVISVPDEQIGLVDVYSVHMPLSPAARNRTTVEVARFIRASRLGSVQVLLGDMNEEPHNASMLFWSGAADLVVPGMPEGELVGIEAPFMDAWLAKHPEPEPRSAEETARAEAFTFPSDDPKKRIDTAFIASLPPSETDLPGFRPDGGISRVSVQDAWIVGQQAVPGTGNSSNPEHVGMVHPDSPLWASDHRGVVFDLVISRS